jgi:outer membrane immunogenic protein
MIMKKLCMIASAAILAAGSVQASGPGAAPSEPIVYHQPVSGFNWGGMYAGGSLGYGSSNYVLSGSINDGQGSGIGLRLPDFGGQGMLGAVQLGYNFMLSDRVVLGVQADATMSRILNRANLSITDPENTLSIDWSLGPRTMYTIAGRLGYLTTPDTMVYGLLGATRGNFRGRLSASFNGETVPLANYDFNLNGMAIGMGIETRLTDRTTLGLEYRYNRFRRYSFFDGELFEGVNAEAGFNTSVQTIRASLNYHF